MARKKKAPGYKPAGHKERIFSPNWKTVGGQPLNSTYDAFGSKRSPSKAELVNAFDDLVYACASLIGSTISTVPIKLYVSTAPGQSKPKCVTKKVDRKTLDKIARTKRIGGIAHVEEVLSHPVLDLLHKVNGFHNWLDLVELTQLYLEISGNSYWLIQRDRFGLPFELYLLPSHQMEPERNAKGFIEKWKFGQATETLEYDPSEIIHFKFPSLTDPYGEGMSPVRAAWQRIMISWRELGYLDSTLSNSARPDIIVSPEGEGEFFPDVEAERLAKDFFQRFKGPNNGGILVSGGRLKVTPLNFNPRDMAELQVYQTLKTTICNVFGIPPEIFEMGTANRASADSCLYSLAVHCIRPRVNRLIEKLNERLLPLYDDRLFFDCENPVPEDRQFELQERQALVNCGAITRDEMRVLYGYPPETWAAEPLLPPGMTTASSQAPELPDQAPEQEQAEPPQDRSNLAPSLAALQEAVYGGTLPREAAIANVQLTFGFTAEQANALFPEIAPVKLAPEEGPPSAPEAPQADPTAPGDQADEAATESPQADDNGPQTDEDLHKLGKAFLEELTAEWQQENEDQKCNGPGGKPGPCAGPGSEDGPTISHHTGSPELHQQAESKASKAVALLKQLPATVAAKVKKKVSDKYEQLKARYGKATAIAVLGAGIAGTLTPIPGGGLLAAAPLLGMAELYLKLRGKSLEFKAAPHVLDLPDYRQQGNYDCGACASHIAASYYGVGPTTESDWIDQLGTNPDEGTRPELICDQLKRLGLQVEDRQGMTLEDLANYTSSGWPVITPIQAYGTDAEEARQQSGHYVIVAGLDNESVAIQDPSAGPSQIPTEDFLNRWKDKDSNGKEYLNYGIAIGPPMGSQGKGLRTKAIVRKSPGRLTETLKSFFAEQRGSVLEKVKSAAVSHFVDVDHWSDVMAKACRPIVQIYYDYSAKQTVQRLGGSFDLLKVVQPGLQEGIDKATFLFCKETNEATSLELDEAIKKLRQEIADGLQVGDTRIELMRRVEGVFDRAEQERAYQIAVSEASRGQHAAQEITAKESGLVKGKRWLLSSDACPECLPLSGKVVPLGQRFTTRGTGAYSDIQYPPLHPLCRCDMVEIIEGVND